MAEVGASHRRSSPARVLLVEDEPDVREAFALALEDEGITVLQAASAEEGLSLLARERVDLVITDYALPGQNGAWLLKEAHRRGLLTGDPLIVSAHPRAAITSGFTVLQKPVELDAFLAAVLSRIAPPEVKAALANEVLFALDASADEWLTDAQREAALAVAQRAAQESGPRTLPGLYRRTEQGVSVLYRLVPATGTLTVLEVRPAAPPER